MKLSALSLYLLAFAVSAAYAQQGAPTNRPATGGGSPPGGAATATQGGGSPTGTSSGGGSTFTVTVGGTGNTFNPPTQNVKAGDVVIFNFAASTHNVIQSDTKDACSKSTNQQAFQFPQTGVAQQGTTWRYTVAPLTPDAKAIWFYCQPHCQGGMTGGLLLGGGGGNGTGGSPGGSPGASGSTGSHTLQLSALSIAIAAVASFFKL